MFQISRRCFSFMSLILISGCVALAPIGPIVSLGIAWVNGEASKYYACEFETIHIAVKNVLQEFKIPIIEEKTEEDSVFIKAGDDDKFKIKIIPTREGITKLLIRVNVMGDKAYAEMLYRHVDQQPGVRQFASLQELNTAMERQKRFRR